MVITILCAFGFGMLHKGVAALKEGFKIEPDTAANFDQGFAPRTVHGKEDTHGIDG